MDLVIKEKYKRLWTEHFPLEGAFPKLRYPDAKTGSQGLESCKAGPQGSHPSGHPIGQATPTERDAP